MMMMMTMTDILQFFVNKCLGRILNIHWPDRIANKELLGRTGQEPVLDQIRRRKWNWLGCTL